MKNIIIAILSVLFVATIILGNYTTKKELKENSIKYCKEEGQLIYDAKWVEYCRNNSIYHYCSLPEDYSLELNNNKDNFIINCIEAL